MIIRALLEKIVGQICLVFDFGWGYLGASGSLAPPKNGNPATAPASVTHLVIEIGLLNRTSELIMTAGKGVGVV